MLDCDNCVCKYCIERINLQECGACRRCSQATNLYRECCNNKEKYKLQSDARIENFIRMNAIAPINDKK